jgi:hypothetical protein
MFFWSSFLSVSSCGLRPYWRWRSPAKPSCFLEWNTDLQALVDNSAEPPFAVFCCIPLAISRSRSALPSAA